MTFNTLFRFGLIIATIIQLLIVLTAEQADDFVRASYEMLWLFFFLYLCHNEFQK